MRSFLLGAVSTIALMNSAGAADIYRGDGGSLKDAPVYASSPSWTGWYLGVNGGYGWNADSKNQNFRDDFTNVSTVTGKSLDAEGGFGGGQIGYNVQSGFLGFGPRFVFGIETDFQGAGISDDYSANGISSIQHSYTLTAKEDLNYFGTVRGRIGYAFDRTLVYATGGFAYGELDQRFKITDTTITRDPRFPVSATGKRDEIATGFVIGGGIEHKLSPAWSLKAEYQYIDLGTDSIKGAEFSADGTPYIAAGKQLNVLTNEIDHTYHTVRVGLNYHITPAYEPLK